MTPAHFVIAVVAYYLLEIVWFSEWIWGPRWRQECGLAAEIMACTPRKIVIRNYVGSFLICVLVTGAIFTLRAKLSELNFPEWMRVVWVLDGAFVVATPLRASLYQKRSLHLLLIEAGYHYVGILLVAALAAQV